MKPTFIHALLVTLGLTNVASAGRRGHGGRTIYVQAPASISNAILGASYGDRIVVKAGTYNEQVLVKKPGIELVANKGVLILPPANPTTNDCSNLAGPGTQAGICIAGEGVVTGGPAPEHEKVLSVRKPIKDVSVSGFNVSGFSGPNIYLLGAKNARVYQNELHDSPTYGFLSAGSEGTLVTQNVITNMLPFAFVGICLDDFNTAEASRNTISNHLVGLCIATSGALIRNNDVSNCCAAAFADPAVDGPKILDNRLHDSLTQCGEFGSFGLVIDGAVNSVVRGNKIERIHNDGGFEAGISVVDDPCSPISGLACSILQRPAVAENNLVTGNSFRGNDLDINVNSTGAGNVVKKNRCDTFQPTDLNLNPCRRG